MYFHSLEFLSFFAVFLLCYFLVPKKSQPLFLLCGNIFFYVQSSFLHLCFLFTTVISVYVVALRLESIEEESQKKAKEINHKEQRKQYKSKIKARKKRYLTLCLLLNLGILAVLKYTDFVLSNVNSLLVQANSTQQFTLYQFLLPLGLSFYTFQSISYVVDVYWKKQKAEKNFIHYASYATFFPQMLQGPISRYAVVSKSFFSPHFFEKDRFYQGFIRFLYGFFKKLLIADHLLPIVAQLTSNPEQYQGIYFLFALFLYAISLYCDFTGGIDISLAMAQMMGITLEENFRTPYLSTSIEEYWRRWHMTMGKFFRDYVFYPLSVSKFMLKLSTKSRRRLGDNLGKRIPFYTTTLTVWFATGLWHGATWNYIFWGLTNGIIILLSKELAPFLEKSREKHPNFFKSKLSYGLAVCRTFWLMCLIRAYDIYATVPLTWKMYQSMFTNFSFQQFQAEKFTTLSIAPIQWISSSFGLIFLLFVGFITRKGESIGEIMGKQPFFLKVAMIYFLLFSMILLGAYGFGYDATQFIYNQF